MTLVERLEKGAYTKEGADELIMEALDYIRNLEEQVGDLEVRTLRWDGD